MAIDRILDEAQPVVLQMYNGRMQCVCTAGMPIPSLCEDNASLAFIIC